MPIFKKCWWALGIDVVMWINHGTCLKNSGHSTTERCSKSWTVLHSDLSLCLEWFYQLCLLYLCIIDSSIVPKSNIRNTDFNKTNGLTPVVKSPSVSTQYEVDLIYNNVE